jgi:long-chain acyl-CoA synthetase
MNSVLTAIQHFAATTPNKVALVGDSAAAIGMTPVQLSYRELWLAIETAKTALLSCGVKRVALKANNSIDWAVADLVAMAAGIILVPVPVFFSARQVIHVLNSAGIDALWGDWPEQDTLSAAPLMIVANLPLTRANISSYASAELPIFPDSTAKITFTSGSTGQPKGVCLSQAHLNRVADTLANQLNMSTTPEQHLVLLPLSTLLENITGLYVPLILGVTSTILAGGKVGLTGSSQFDARTFTQAMLQFTPQSLVLTPALLVALTAVAQSFPEITTPLKFVAIGGARVTPQLLQHAHAAGIPAYEGYGLSECGSVVSLNSPGASKLGSCGKVLPHCNVTFADDGEVLVSGTAMLGYIGCTEPPELINTGDLGYLDQAGYLHITGRKKNLLITSYGRNISPEWIESEAQAFPELQRIVVIGDGCSALTAIVATAHATSQQVIHALTMLNDTLPDYATIHAVIIALPFEHFPELLTSNGRPRRDRFEYHFQAQLTQLQDRHRVDNGIALIDTRINVIDHPGSNKPMHIHQHTTSTIQRNR